MIRIKFNKKLCCVVMITAFLLITSSAYASKGVSINVGSITVDETLYPGRSYQLASITVHNTGTETSDYTLSFIYAEGQEEYRPDPAWLLLEPEQMTLHPGEQASVSISLRLPIKVRPGKYFAFLAAHPVRPAEGGVAVGVAAAARLSFEVVPATYLQGLLFRIGDGFARHAPWSYLTVGIIAVGILGAIAMRRFYINIQVQRKVHGPDDRGG